MFFLKFNFILVIFSGFLWKILSLSSKKRLREKQFKLEENRISELINLESRNDKSELISQIRRNIINNQNMYNKFLESFSEMEKNYEDAVTKANNLSSEKENLENDINENRKTLKKVKAEFDTSKKEIIEISDTIKVFNQLLIKKKSERFRILYSCKMNDVPIKVRKGSLSDVIRMSEEVDRIKIDYNLLPQEYKCFQDDEITDKCAEFEKEIERLQEILNSTFSTLKVSSNEIKQLRNQFKEAKEMTEEARNSLSEAEIFLNNIKNERCNKFKDCFNVVSERINDVYAELTKNQAAKMKINYDNSKEPYLGGVTCKCLIPGKYFLPIEALSNTERLMASMALFFAVRSFKAPLFLVLDHVEYELTIPEVEKIAEYLYRRMNYTQLLVYSSDTLFRTFSDGVLLIGVRPEGEHSEYTVNYADISQASTPYPHDFPWWS